MIQTVGRRSADPAASLASFFTQRSKRNGEIVEVHAREVFSDAMELSAFELTIQVRTNGYANAIADSAVHFDR